MDGWMDGWMDCLTPVVEGKHPQSEGGGGAGCRVEELLPTLHRRQIGPATRLRLLFAFHRLRQSGRFRFARSNGLPQVGAADEKLEADGDDPLHDALKEAHPRCQVQ